MKFTELLVAAVLVSRALAVIRNTMVMIPMYIPLTPGSWNGYFTSIQCNPAVQFNLVINPDSGPGSSTYPNADYISRIAQLRSYNNTKLIGYVRTAYGAQPIATIESNITKYANWKNYSGANITMDGIFFDESPSTWTATIGTYMTSISSFARHNLTSVTFNAGTVADARFFPLADYVIIFEDYYSAWTPSYVTYLNMTYNWTQRAKSVVMMYDFTGTAIQQYDVTQQATSMGLAGLFVTQSRGYEILSTFWNAFIAILQISNSGL